MLGLGFAAGSVLARWRRSPRQALRALAACLVRDHRRGLRRPRPSAVPAGFQRSARVRTSFPGPPVPDIVNVRDGLGYPCAMRGYGVIRGYEPMLSYYRDAPTLRLAREDPGYRGEAWTESGTVQPVSWSPNRLVFQVEPGQDVHINQNPGSWWWANGRPAFPDRRCRADGAVCRQGRRPRPARPENPSRAVWRRGSGFTSWRGLARAGLAGPG